MNFEKDARSLEPPAVGKAAQNNTIEIDDVSNTPVVIHHNAFIAPKSGDGSGQKTLIGADPQHAISLDSSEAEDRMENNVIAINGISDVPAVVHSDSSVTPETGEGSGLRAQSGSSPQNIRPRNVFEVVVFNLTDVEEISDVPVVIHHEPDLTPALVDSGVRRSTGEVELEVSSSPKVSEIKKHTENNVIRKSDNFDVPAVLHPPKSPNASGGDKAVEKDIIAVDDVSGVPAVIGPKYFMVPQSGEGSGPRSTEKVDLNNFYSPEGSAAIKYVGSGVPGGKNNGCPIPPYVKEIGPTPPNAERLKKRVKFLLDDIGFPKPPPTQKNAEINGLGKNTTSDTSVGKGQEQPFLPKYPSPPININGDLFVPLMARENAARRCSHQAMKKEDLDRLIAKHVVAQSNFLSLCRDRDEYPTRHELTVRGFPTDFEFDILDENPVIPFTAAQLDNIIYGLDDAFGMANRNWALERSEVPKVDEETQRMDKKRRLPVDFTKETEAARKGSKDARRELPDDDYYFL
ncbi:hypothetical protein L873DRAFT_1793690 [Choiromyces venosus 120613-1]|uniref:Uncharacterized protein n=1 Tax=Choiromyces venosus 120613-1 TaxID=1336337 RepID=A0A3N4J5B2_9PEZI|nr:hypothetical protein L873DRAFT_1793690 [Choiromyces venosus 120613-1]